MKIIIIFIIFLMFMCGCTTVTYDPETNLVKYTRIGSIKAKDVLVELDGNKVHVEVGSTESDVAELIRAIFQLGFDAGKGIVP